MANYEDVVAALSRRLAEIEVENTVLRLDLATARDQVAELSRQLEESRAESLDSPE